MYQFPFGTMHQINLDWFLQQWEIYKQEWADAQAGIDNALQGEIDRVEDAMTDLYNARDVAVQAKEDAEDAADSVVSDAAQCGADALKSEGYAVGEQDGTPVGAGSPYYQSNAKYYKVEAGTYRYLAEAYAKGEMGGSPVAPGEAGYQDNAKYYKDAADADAVQTAADRVQTGLDRTATGNDAAATAQDKLDTDTLKDAANAAALRAEGWADGEQNGTPVGPDSPYYENNTKYYMNRTETAAASIPQDYQGLLDIVNNSLKTEITVIFQDYYSIDTNKAIGTYINPNSGAPSSSFSMYIMKVSKGDVAVISGRGGSAPKVWALTDNDFILLSLETSTTISNKTVNVTQDGYLILNANMSNPRSAVISTFNPNTVIYDTVFKLIRRIAYFEPGNVASKAYAVNDLMIKYTPDNGRWPMFHVYRVTAAIAAGATLTAGTNIAETTIGNLITSILNS